MALIGRRPSGDQRRLLGHWPPGLTGSLLRRGGSRLRHAEDPGLDGWDCRASADVAATVECERGRSIDASTSGPRGVAKRRWEYIDSLCQRDSPCGAPIFAPCTELGPDRAQMAFEPPLPGASCTFRYPGATSTRSSSPSSYVAEIPSSPSSMSTDWWHELAGWDSRHPHDVSVDSYRHPNVNTKASTPGSRNSIWNSPSPIGPGWRSSWYNRW
jgi:hypothetical protein